MLEAFVLSGCATSHVGHDARAAVQTATEFAQMVFVQEDVDGGYGLLSDASKRTISIQEFRSALSRMHPAGHPVTVTATDFEIVPGQKMMNVFLRGEGGSEVFFYRLAMEGTAETGYRVSGLFRGSGPYPASPFRRSLKGPHGG